MNSSSVYWDGQHWGKNSFGKYNQEYCLGFVEVYMSI